jgi:hypothetical protein
VKRLLARIVLAFRCRHCEISWPHTNPKTGATTVVCQICNRRLEYSWSKMRIMNGPYLTLLTMLIAIPLAAQPHSVTLNWTDALNPPATTSYFVYRAPGACNTLPVFGRLAAAPATTYTDTAVQAGLGYCYQITATDGTKESAPSNAVPAQIPAITPPPPISVVQHRTGQTKANQTTVTTTINPTGTGNLLAVATGNSASRNVVGVSDGIHAFTQAPGAIGSDASGHQTDIWFLPISTAGRTSITVTFAGAPGTFNKELWFWEVAGFVNPILDVTGSVHNGAQSAGVASGASVAVTTSPEFIAAVNVTSGSVTGNPQPGNEFTAGGDVSATQDAAVSLIATGVPAAHQARWTDNGSSFASSTAAFKESGALPPPLPTVSGIVCAASTPQSNSCVINMSGPVPSGGMTVTIVFTSGPTTTTLPVAIPAGASSGGFQIHAQ